ncbi:MAG: hypothetical protein ACVCEJ_10520 [Candidatus Izemoplasmataceae bacterium]
MKKSEELMLLLTYNKLNSSTYHLRKQLSFETTHPNTLLFNASLEELIRLDYGKNKAELYLFKNPLMYHHTWPKEIKSIEQFYVQTKESNRVVSIKEIIDHPAYKGAGLKRILQDIFAKYIEEYNVAFLTMLKRIKKLYFLLPKKEINILKNFKKKILFSLFIFVVLFAIFLIPSQTIFMNNFLQKFIDIVFHNSSIIQRATLTIGRLSLLVYLIYFVIYFAFKSQIKDVQEMQIIHRNFDEDKAIENHQNHIEKVMLNIQLYIEKIEHEQKDNYPLLEHLSYEQKEVQNYIKNLSKIHQKNDQLQKQKPFFIETLNISYFVALILSVIFILSIIIQVLIGVVFHV